jgi:hypothetical protein
VTDNYNEILQRTATKVWELRTEHDRVTKERDQAQERQEHIASRLREAETELSRCVGANQRTKMWIVRTGTAVIARYRDNLTTIDVLDAEPQE